MDRQRIALVMLKPDAVRQRLTGRVVRWLAARGFQALRFREFELTVADRAALYGPTRAVGRLDWELNAVLYRLGPVQALLLAGPLSGRWPSAAQYVSSGLKGDFRPARAVPGTMRADLGALNPIFNLVHATDDVANLDREQEVLFGADRHDGDELLRLTSVCDQPAA